MLRRYWMNHYLQSDRTNEFLRDLCHGAVRGDAVRRSGAFGVLEKFEPFCGDWPVQTTIVLDICSQSVRFVPAGREKLRHSGQAKVSSVIRVQSSVQFLKAIGAPTFTSRWHFEIGHRHCQTS